MYMYDTLVFQADALKRNHACLKVFEDQARDASEVLWQHRVAREKAEKKEEELRIALLAA